MEETENNSWPHQIAGASILAPGVVLAMSFAFRTIQQSTQFQSRAIILAVAGIGALLLVFGFLFSIIAMCAIPRYGSARILGRSIVGLLANALLLFIFVTGFMHGRQQALARNAATRDLRATARELQSELQKNYDPKLGVTNNRPGLEQMQRLNSQFQNAAHNATGDDAAVMQALSEHMQRMQTAANRYQMAASKYQYADLLSSATLNDKSEIQRRREAVRTLMTANSELKQVVVDNEKHIRADMGKRGIAPTTIESTIQAYRTTAGPRSAVILKIRDCDQRRADATLQILNLYESDWGRWHYDTKTEILSFQNPESKGKYNKLFDEFEAANNELVKLQGQLLKIR
jgi:hypothetical protein